MYNLDRIRKEVKEICVEAGCKISMPININGRLTRTLGRVMYSNKYASRMEFSKAFIENSTDDSIRQTILHECAHYIAWYRTGERHGHDSLFKQICAEIGCVEDKTTSHVESLKSPDKTIRYAIYCPNCGFIDGRHKWCDTLENLPYCRCGKCGSEELSYVANW